MKRIYKYASGLFLTRDVDGIDDDNCECAAWRPILAVAAAVLIQVAGLVFMAVMALAQAFAGDQVISGLVLVSGLVSAILQAWAITAALFTGLGLATMDTLMLGFI